MTDDRFEWDEDDVVITQGDDGPKYFTAIHQPSGKRIYASVDNALEILAEANEHGAYIFRDAITVEDRIEHMTSLTASELRGICAAVTQQSTRALAHGLLSKQRPAKIAREIVARIDAVGKTRSHMLINYAVVKAFNGASLDAFRQAGFKKVGTIPEKLRVARGPHGKHLVRDEARITPQRRHGRTGQFIPFRKPLSAAKQKRIEEEERRVQALGSVEVLTSGLDNVCPICLEISNSGPYSIDEAEGLIPAHPFCSCSYVPAYDLRFAPVYYEDGLRDAFDPDEERDDHGRWTGAASSQYFAKTLGAGFPHEGAKLGEHDDNRPGVGFYAGLGNSFELNRTLRTRALSGHYVSWLSPEYERAANQLTEEIDASPRVPEDITAYRGVRQTFADTLQQGSSFTDAAFVSTTLDQNIAKHHDEGAGRPMALMVMHVPKGTKALAVKGSTEKELILQRGLSYRVNKISGGKRKTVEVEVV